ncbi:hypothetical protein ACIRPX_05175 [Streptomyces sp. NPDC101225]|uniref:hypothetical protein n=1 Tax=Streptomyces sp. NPDC101225 TaxID=3366135 RepID=UPI0038172AA5
MTAPPVTDAPGFESGASGLTAGDVTALWASAQVTALNVHDFPQYGSPAWLALKADDPARAAAIITAAEQWRRHNAREQWLDRLLDSHPTAWYRVVTAEADREARRILPKLARRPTIAEIKARNPRPVPRPVVATPGWPPVALPGRPGWYRHCGPDGEQTDRPRTETP